MTCVGPSSPVFKRNKADFAKPSDAQKTAVLLALSVAELKIRHPLRRGPLRHAPNLRRVPVLHRPDPLAPRPKPSRVTFSLSASRASRSGRHWLIDWRGLTSCGKRRRRRPVGFIACFDIIYGQKVIYDARAERCARCSD
jgi:hypothetical protein